MPFYLLPAEVRPSVLIYLGYKFVASLIFTNHYFRSMRNPSILRQTLLTFGANLSEEPIIRPYSPLEGQEWPCYICLVPEIRTVRATVAFSTIIGATYAGT